MANIGLTLKGNAITEDDGILSLRLLEPTCTETDTTLTIRSATAVKQNGQTVKAYTVPRKPSDFTGGSYDFSTVASSIPANNYCYALVTINSVDQIEVVLGAPSATEAGATIPTTANYQVALVKLKKGAFSLESIKNSDVTDRRATNQINDQPVFYTTDHELISEQYLAHVADNFVAYPNTVDNSVDFGTNKTSVSQYTASNTMTLNYSTRTGIVGLPGTILSLDSAPSFSVRAGCWVGSVPKYTFNSSTISVINTALQSAGRTERFSEITIQTLDGKIPTLDTSGNNLNIDYFNTYYKLQGDSATFYRSTSASGNLTGLNVESSFLITGTSSSFSLQIVFPTWTITVFNNRIRLNSNITIDNIYLTEQRQQGYAFADVVGSRTFSRITGVTNQTTFTLAAPLPAFSGTFNILEPIYTKNLVTELGDSTQKTRLADVFTGNVDSVVIDYDDSVTSGDIDFDGGLPNIVCLVSNGNVDDYTTALRPSTKTGSLIETFTKTPSNNLTLVFLPNLTSGNGVFNLLWYSCFLFKDPNLFSGGIINQSFGYTTSPTGLNCTFSVESGKTVITLTDNFPNYVMNVNTGTPFGDLIVEDFGIEIPRKTTSLTDDNLPYYIETAHNKITLWEDLSTTVRQITIKRRLGTQDVSSTNTLRLNAAYEAIVGSTANVASGIATHSSLQSAIDALSSGSRILVLAGTYTENVTLSKNDISIVGKGRTSILNGNLSVSGSGNDIQGLKVGGNLTLTGSTYCFVKCWLSSTSTYTAGVGSSNSVNTIQE
jgi:hypothetical protein